METQVNYQKALQDEIQAIPEEALPNLLQMIRLFRESLLMQREQAAVALQQEFAEWDLLSDEALLNFEKELGS